MKHIKNLSFIAFILFSVNGFAQASATNFINSITIVKNHINGSAALSATNLNAQKTILTTNVSALSDNESAIKSAFELVALFETTKGALFTKNSTTEGGYTRTASGFELENIILYVSQSLLDYAYTQANLSLYRSTFNNKKFETSSFFPGSVTPPANPNTSYTLTINGTHLPVRGSKANYETEDARRPTGCYLAPGSVAEVIVPASLVNSGASILVGAQTWDLSSKPTIKRMDRVTTKYEITQTTVTIANPLGGGIYINIPYEKDFGEFELSIENVVRSPYYSSTKTKTTSLNEWQNTERSNPAPWTDFETDRFMMQVPTAWVYNMTNPATLLGQWDQALDAVSKLHGRPLVRGKTVLYVQVDVIIRGSANFPGYPQSNHAYNPYNTHTAGNFSGHPLLQGPRYNVNNLNIVFHELGHAEKIPKFTGETESYVNFLWVAVQNNAFDVDLDLAFQQSFSPNFNMTLDDAAVTWMIAENFRKNNPMSDVNGGRQAAYQHRGHGKYAEIVKLFGWKPLEDFYESVSEDADNGITYEINNDPTDSRILRMSKAAGIDLRPLIHFWGVHPLNFNSLETSIETAGLIRSAKIYDMLQYYKTIVPMTNQSFRNFGLKHFSQSSITNYSGTNIWSYSEGFYNHWWNEYDEEEANATLEEIDYLIALYFPEGRPCEVTTVTPYSKINSEGWKNNGIVAISEGDTIKFGPHPNRNTSWKWTGPNGFTSSTREITLTNALEEQAGDYVGTYTDAYGCETTLTYVLTITPVITSITPEQLTNLISIYPNPANNQFTLAGAKDASFEVIDLKGRVVTSGNIHSNQQVIDVGSLSQGQYFIQVITTDNISIEKLLLE